MVALQGPSGETADKRFRVPGGVSFNERALDGRFLDSSIATLRRVRWNNVAALALIHILAGLAILPWLFSWTGVVLAVLGTYAFATLGINIGYHRLLTHRGLVCPRWLEYTFATLGTCCAQDSPPIWVAIHRRHHQMSDGDGDPHSPTSNVLWGYVGWLLIKQDHLEPKVLLDRYARDLMRDPFYAWLNRSDNWIKVVIGSWFVFFALGTLAAAALGSDAYYAIQFGLSVMIWGALVRTALTLHITWFANTMDHLWGYRNYDTPDNSRNNMFISVLTNGEGWHNNHHADPSSANHGHRPGEFDLSWQTIRLLMKLGLARDVVTPSTSLASTSGAAAPQTRDRKRVHSSYGVSITSDTF